MRHSIALRLLIVLCTSMLVSCGNIAGTGPTPSSLASSTPVAPGTALPSECFLQSVFTAEAMQKRVSCHPSDYKMLLSDDTSVLFAFPDSHMDWIGPIFVIHVPSVSEAILKTDGSIFQHSYKTPEGQAAIEKVLNNASLMAQVIARAQEIARQSPAPYVSGR